MNLATIRTLFEYSVWATERIFTQVAALTPEQYTTPPNATMPSVRRILVHALAAETLWLTRLRTGSSAMNLGEDDFPDLPTLRQAWERQQQAMLAHLDTLSDESLAQPFRFERRGVPLEMVLWQIFFQLINHGTQHRSEVAAIVTEYGHSPGDLDFMIFVMQRER
ncbi:MAG TPA: DinB family protein [Thermomicrobiales bacterium]|jgi:uncharacterized damage-inducible protein DinB